MRGSQRTSHPLKKVAVAASSTTFRSIEVLNVKCCMAMRQSKADEKSMLIEKSQYKNDISQQVIGHEPSLSCHAGAPGVFFIRDCVSGLASAPVKPTAPVSCRRATRDSGVR